MKFHFANPELVLPRNGKDWYAGVINKQVFERLSRTIAGEICSWYRVDVVDGMTNGNWRPLQ